MLFGLAAGIMIASGIFGLLIPGMEKLKILYGNLSAIHLMISFLLGSLLIYIIDKTTHFYFHNKTNQSTNIKLLTAISIHNIPEGLAVGLACGAALIQKENESMINALIFSIGIAIQNIPEGSVVSLPLYESGKTKFKSFTNGLITGIIEPIFAIIGMVLATKIETIMPNMLVFASGSMTYVTIDELLPRIKEGKNPYFGLFSFLTGFLMMLILEILL